MRGGCLVSSCFDFVVGDRGWYLRQEAFIGWGVSGRDFWAGLPFILISLTLVSC